MPLLDGIIGCWSPSIRGSGYLLPDLSGRGNHGTLTNMDAGTDWPGASVRGVSGKVLDFDGTNDYVDFGTQVNLGGATYASFSAWVWRATVGDMNVLMRYNTNLAAGTLRGDSFAVGTNTVAGQCILVVRGNGILDYLLFYSTEAITANTWNHIAGSVFVNGTSSTCVMALNGNPCTVNTAHSGTRPTAYAANNTVAWQSMSYIGSSGTRFYDSGRVGELAVWRAPKTVAELCQLNRLGNGWIGRELTGQTRRRVYGFVPAGFKAYWARRQNQIIGGGV